MRESRSIGLLRPSAWSASAWSASAWSACTPKASTRKARCVRKGSTLSLETLRPSASRPGSWRHRLGTRTASAFAAALLGLAVGGCAPRGGDPEGVASYRGGAVSAADLDQALLAVPEDSRPSAPGELRDFVGEMVRRIAVRDIVVRSGREDRLLEIPENASTWEATRTQLAVSTYLRREVEVEAPSAEEVESYFEEHRESFARPERREVYHLFLRPRPGESRAQLLVRAQELRDRAVAGTPFPLLAREHSESQLKRGDGALGWVVPGQLSPNLDRIVFGLEEAVPSDVMTTASGAHLFYAARIVEAQPANLETSRSAVRQRLWQQRQEAAVQQFVESRPTGPADFVPSSEELAALLVGGDPMAVVLRVGGLVLTAEELAEELEGAGSVLDVAQPERAHEWLVGRARRERVAVLAAEAGILEEEEFLPVLEESRNALLYNLGLTRELETRVLEDRAALEAFFGREAARFAGSPRLRYRRLARPIDADAGRIMTDLVRALPALRSGSLSLTDLAAEVGATVEPPQWSSLERLVEEGGGIRRSLAAVGAGEFSDPHSNGREVELFEVIERGPLEVPALGEVEERVVEAYLEAHGESLFEEFSSELLAANGFELHEAALDAYLREIIGLPAA